MLKGSRGDRLTVTGEGRWQSGVTLNLELPASCEEPTEATAKWLLALWQASRKTTWSIWRDRALVSLELIGKPQEIHYQCHFASSLLAETSSAILGAHFDGIETTRRAASDVFDCDARGVGALTTFALRSPGWIELPDNRHADGIPGVLATLGSLREQENLAFQLLLAPTWMTTDDGRGPAFWLAGRIVSFAGAESSAMSRVRMASSAFGQFAGFNGLRFSPVRRLEKGDFVAFMKRNWPRRLLPTDPPATALQVATLYHPPARPAAIKHLQTITYNRAATTTLSGSIELGEGRDAFGRPATVRLAPADLLRHAFVLGPSGSGKTTFLAHLARELAGSGHGLTVIDPHGSLVGELARTLPPERTPAASLLRFADSEHPISLNPFRVMPGQESRVADEVVEAIQRVQGREYWGPLLDLLLRHVAIATAELRGSLVEAARLLDDPWFRQKALPQVSNPETARFLGQLPDTAPYDRRFLPAVQRLQRLISTPSLRNILGQPDSGLDFRRAFSRREILLADLSGIGAASARLLGSLILLLIRQATLDRPGDTSRRNPLHFVLVDEASWFLSRTIAELFDQARKFGVGVILATQRLGQLAPEETREAVIANAANLFIFRINDREEAQYFGRHLGSDQVTTADLQHLPRYEAYARLTRDGEQLTPAWLKTPTPARQHVDADELERQLLAAGRARYARPRKSVETALERREHTVGSDEEPEIRVVDTPAAAVPAYAT